MNGPLNLQVYEITCLSFSFIYVSKREMHFRDVKIAEINM